MTGRERILTTRPIPRAPRPSWRRVLGPVGVAAALLVVGAEALLLAAVVTGSMVDGALAVACALLLGALVVVSVPKQ